MVKEHVHGAGNGGVWVRPVGIENEVVAKLGRGRLQLSFVGVTGDGALAFKVFAGLETDLLAVLEATLTSHGVVVHAAVANGNLGRLHGGDLVRLEKVLHLQGRKEELSPDVVVDGSRALGHPEGD